MRVTCFSRDLVKHLKANGVHCSIGLLKEFIRVADVLLCIIAAYASLKTCGPYYTAEPFVNIFSSIKRNKIERTKLKGIPFSSPSFGTVPSGRAMLLPDLQMACKSPLCIALSCIIDTLVLLLLHWAPSSEIQVQEKAG